MSPQEHQHKETILAGEGQLAGISIAKDMPDEKTAKTMEKPQKIDIDSPAALINRELSWLSFARRVLALAEDPELPLLERVKFAGIMGMLYDEFAMKRMGGLKRKIEKRKHKSKQNPRCRLRHAPWPGTGAQRRPLWRTTRQLEP